MNDVFTTIPQYITSQTTLRGKILAYDTIIAGLEQTMLLAVSSGDIKQYELDDGMMKVRQEFRSLDDITNAMQGFEKIRQMYINRYNGRTITLRSGCF